MTCSIEGCGKPLRNTNAGSGWCAQHYHRWYRHGDPLFVKPRAFKDFTGQRIGMLTVQRRATINEAGHGWWVVRCDCGIERLAASGELNRAGDNASCGDRSAQRAITPGYRAAHDRHRRLLGRAADHTCVNCGEQARHWAYDHDADDEVASPTGAYSVDAAHYQPRCVRCHKRYDMARINGTEFAPSM